MTTAVTVDAHAGWLVQVSRIHTVSGALESTVRVEPFTKQTVYTWDGVHLDIRELTRAGDSASAPAQPSAPVMAEAV